MWSSCKLSLLRSKPQLKLWSTCSFCFPSWVKNMSYIPNSENKTGSVSLLKIIRFIFGKAWHDEMTNEDSRWFFKTELSLWIVCHRVIFYQCIKMVFLITKTEPWFKGALKRFAGILNKTCALVEPSKLEAYSSVGSVIFNL